MRALHRRIAAAVLVASLLVLVPATARAATKTYSFSISGTEVSATETTGRFVGAASGSAVGTWYAEVNHDRLGGGDGAQVAIQSGGSFGMALAPAEPAYVVSGQFADGTITTSSSGTSCKNQLYKVDGELKNVSVTGTGQFFATLTHHRRSVLGRCLLYAATVSGTVTLGGSPESRPPPSDHRLHPAGPPRPATLRECPRPRAVTTCRLG